MGDKGDAPQGRALVVILASLLALSSNLYGMSKCENFNYGLREGYCQKVVLFGGKVCPIFIPGHRFHKCEEDDHKNNEQAYKKGWLLGFNLLVHLETVSNEEDTNGITCRDRPAPWLFAGRRRS